MRFDKLMPTGEVEDKFKLWQHDLWLPGVDGFLDVEDTQENGQATSRKRRPEAHLIFSGYIVSPLKNIVENVCVEIDNSGKRVLHLSRLRMKLFMASLRQLRIPFWVILQEPGRTLNVANHEWVADERHGTESRLETGLFTARR